MFNLPFVKDCYAKLRNFFKYKASFYQKDFFALKILL